jgi:hypothetical protein
MSPLRAPHRVPLIDIWKPSCFTAATHLLDRDLARIERDDRLLRAQADIRPLTNSPAVISTGTGPASVQSRQDS